MRGATIWRVVLVAAGLATLASAGDASGGSCGSASVGAGAARQEAVMSCLVNSLRSEHGLRPLRNSSRLGRAAELKAAAIVRCGHLSHTPCGRSFASTFHAAGYAVGNWAAGENLAWGAGARGSVAQVFARLLDSAPHRANFLGRWKDMGVALRRGPLFGYPSASLWVINFGRR
jgi:uncharacterized protein YkwD